MADERKIVDKLREMGFALQDDFSLGKKLKIQPVRIGMPGSREEGTAFGPPRRDTPYPIDNIRVLEEKGEYYVALFSSRAGSKPVTFRKIPVASLQPTPTIGASPTPSARAIVPTPTPGAPSPTTTPYPPVPTPMPTPSPSPSPSPTPEGYIIVIRLMTERGNPVTNVAVSLDGTTQTTNGSGNATFRNVSVGPHLITAPMTATVGGISYNFSNWQDDPGAGPSRQYNVQRSGILLGIYRSGGPTPTPRPPTPSPTRGPTPTSRPTSSPRPPTPGPSLSPTVGPTPGPTVSPSPSPTISPQSPNIRIWGLIDESYPGGKRPLPGARVRIVRRGGLGGLGRFFGRPHGDEIPPFNPTDPNFNGVSGNDGKYDYRAWIDPNETPLIVNIVASRGQFEEKSEMIEIPNLRPRQKPIRSPITGSIIGYEDVLSTHEQNKNYALDPTGRARKSTPAREKIRGEFYTHFGWGGLLWALAAFALLWWFYNDIIGRILTFFGLEDFFLLNSPLVRIGIPLAIALFVYFAYRAGGSWKVIKYVLPVAGVYFLIFFVIDLHTIGDLINFDWYLDKLDLLRWLGISQDTIDGMKDGVRNTLSFLQFKGAEPAKPEAKKIGGFEAMQLKFGSGQNDYLLPTLFARMDYTLPLAVTNPNKFDTNLVGKSFLIDEIFLKNGSTLIMCGSTTATGKDADGNPISVLKGKIELGDVNPEEEKVIVIDFMNKTNCIDVVADARGYDAAEKGAANPMFPVKVRIAMSEEDAENECKEELTKDPPVEKDQACVNVLNDFYTRYQISASALSKDVSAKFIKSDSACECKINRYFNIMDELCFMDNNQAKASLRSNFGFSVQGKGEMILVKSDADRKLAPKPEITSSAGPLTVTTYFISDIHVPDKTETTRMFVQIANDGDGTAQIEDLRKTATPSGVTIGACVPTPNKAQNTKIPVNKDGITVSCPVTVTADAIGSITGSYLTIPVIVDIDYTYQQTHSTTINVKKETIPDGVIDNDQIKELNRQFKPLPYYCPTKNVNDPNDEFDTVPLKIYG